MLINDCCGVSIEHSQDDHFLEQGFPPQDLEGNPIEASIEDTPDDHWQRLADWSLLPTYKILVDEDTSGILDDHSPPQC